MGGYKPQKYNKAQHTLVLLDDQSFTVSRKVTKEKELPKPSFENVISPNRFDLLGCNKNENENLDHREEYKQGNATHSSRKKFLKFKWWFYSWNFGKVDNRNKNVTEQDLTELFGLRTANYCRNTWHVKLILSSKTNNSRGFACITGPKHVCNELVKLNEIEFQEKILVIGGAKRKFLDTFINTITANSSQKFQW